MAEYTVTFESTLLSLLESKKYSAIKDILATMNGADVAAIFDEIKTGQIPLMFRLLPKELAAETFVEMDPEDQELLIKGFSDAELHDVINELYVDDAADAVMASPFITTIVDAVSLLVYFGIASTLLF